MNKPLVILLADDSSEDVLLMEIALERTHLEAALQVVSDGEQAIRYLQGHGQYSDRSRFPIPSLIILDIKMPLVSGLGVLRWLSEQPELKVIPKIIMSTSRLEEEITQSYRLGANTYFVKPQSLHDLKKVLTSLQDYWTHAQLPGPP
jgi:CheY-like chemotaxis protein